MDDLLFRSRLSSALVTGTPRVERPARPSAGRETGTDSFRKVLEQQLDQRQALSFSKHAAARIEERNLQLTESDMARLHEGVEMARQKGLDDALIIMDKTAFIVSAKNATIITALGGNDLKGNVITNITGTVIV